MSSVIARSVGADRCGEDSRGRENPRWMCPLGVVPDQPSPSARIRRQSVLRLIPSAFAASKRFHPAASSA